MLSRAVMRCNNARCKMVAIPARATMATPRFMASAAAATAAPSAAAAAADATTDATAQPLEVVKLSIAEFPHKKYNFMLDRYKAFVATRLAPDEMPVTIEITEDPSILGGFYASCMMRSISMTDRQRLDTALQNTNLKEILPTPPPSDRSLDETRNVVESLLTNLNEGSKKRIQERREAVLSRIPKLIELDDQLQKDMKSAARRSA